MASEALPNPQLSARAPLSDAICPWCIADGSAHRNFHTSSVDAEAFGDDTPVAPADEIALRTPGYNSRQGEAWPSCCVDATAFIAPVGIREIRRRYREWKGEVLAHIIYNMQISGGAGQRLLESLHRDSEPTAFLYQGLHCGRNNSHVTSRRATPAPPSRFGIITGRCSFFLRARG